VNTSVDPVDPASFPYAMAAAAPTPSDRVGAASFVRALTSAAQPALVIVQNDLAATHAAAVHLATLRQRGVQLPPIVNYFPVDCGVRRDFGGMLLASDVNLTCSSFAQREVARAFPELAVSIIPHGVDTAVFRPLSERAAVRQVVRRALRVPEDALLICSVAANNARKDLPRTIAAFAEFRARYSRPTALYLHTLPFSNGIDLNAAVSACSLQAGRDVVFPPNYHPLATNLDDRALNELYNACDLYFTTTLGEGWGLPITEAMAAGLPVVAPRHSALAEHGECGRSILFECAERVWVDNSGYRPWAHLDAMVAALGSAASLSVEARSELVAKALSYAHSLDWSRVMPHWLMLVKNIFAASAG
jgi:glycosyltransferase involved in cell wall biosynthesis